MTSITACELNHATYPTIIGIARLPMAVTGFEALKLQRTKDWRE